MAYVNVAEWTPDHVAEWLRGLEYSILPYVHFFLNNGIDGRHLLNLIADDLEELHIFKVGHQQLILEAVELLRQLHYNLNSETLQSLAVKLGCKARSLYNELKLNGPQDHVENVPQERVSMDVLSAVSEVLTSVKLLISWLDRLPFQRDHICAKLKKAVLKLSIELASTTQRDQFAERPHTLIKRNSLHLAELCDKFVQDSKDSLILQPASLDIAMIKKKPDEELGIHIKSTYSGVHIIGGIKDQSPAKRCNKVEKGDEIIQVNYQTVIGWQQKKLVTAMTEHATDVHLTLKKRPRHINILGEVIILRPYRIPSKKTASKRHKWPEESQLHAQDTCSTSNESEILRDDFNEDEDDSAFLPSDATASQILLEPPLYRRLLPGTSPASVQRRATVSGSSPTVLKPPVNIKDLVNGVTRIKACENIARSISHDPSCPGKSAEYSENTLNIKFTEPAEDIDDISNDLMKEISADCYMSSIDGESSEEPNAKIGLSASNDLVSGSPIKNRSPVPILDALTTQEEECTILESKSVEKVHSYVTLRKKIPSNEIPEINNKASSLLLKEPTSSYAVSFTPVVSNPGNDAGRSSADKHNTLLYNWIGADTEFCGRRPSAHDISNEIAGSKVTDINPVFLRKASKIETSLFHHDSEDTSKEPKEASYQVVVVGGVPQKCVPITKDGKKGSDHLLSSHRKKDSIVGKFANRRISCKDLGMGDCQGWLYKQKEKKGFFPSSHQWTKRWIVLKNHFLYSYKEKSDAKAECLISLPGSTVSPALECKSKKYAFKVCQQKTTFYFATESQMDLTKWMNKMGLAAIAYDATSDITTSGFLKPEIILGVANNFYSETEDSENGSPRFQRHNDEYSYGNVSPGSSSSEHSTDQMLKSENKIKNYSSASGKRISSKLSSHKDGKYHVQDRKYSDSYLMKEKGNSQIREFYDTQVPHVYTSCTQSAINKLNFERPTVIKAHKVSYNRSFSCTDTSYTHYRHNSRFFTRKMSHESSLIGDSLPLKYNKPHSVVKSNTVGNWPAEEEYDILTSSLGRQKVAKEITPGLVARMAISYSNLSQKNSPTTSASKKQNYSKAVPAPGYVAKISDSFDHLAKMSHSSETSMCHDKKSQFLYVSSSSSHRQHPSCKRSASESQVSKSIPNSGRRTESLNYYSQSASATQFQSPGRVVKQSPPEKFVTLLDKEYYRVFEGKKVSQHQLKSQTSIGFFDKRGPGEMKFFPNDDSFTNTLNFKDQSNQRHNEESSNSQNMVNLKYSPDSGVIVDTGDHINMSNTSSFQQTPSPETYSKYLKDSCLSEYSKGIENIGFQCVEQASLNSLDSSVSSGSFNDTSIKRLSHCSIEDAGSYDANHLSVVTPEETLQRTSPKNQSFKFFSSPKFMKKLTSPKLDKKNIFKSKKQAKELKKAEQKEIAAAAAQNDRKFFGSPRLARAFFGSPKTQNKIVTVSSAVQTDVITPPISEIDPTITIQETTSEGSITSCSSVTKPNSCTSSLMPDNQDNLISKSSSNSSLNSNASSSIHSNYTNSHFYVETRIKPQITISLPLVTDKNSDNRASTPETPRTPLKPTMGIAMLSKRRLPSISGESSVSITSSKGSQEESNKESSQMRSEVSIDINDDEMLNVLDSLHRADITLDGVDLRTRRCRTMFMPNDNKRQSQLVLSVRALQRTLKDKETELEAIKELCDQSCISREMVVRWKSIYSHLPVVETYLLKSDKSDC